MKVVYLPDLPEHGDVSDFLTNHTAQELLDEINRTPQWFPEHEVSGFVKTQRNGRANLRPANY